MLPWLPQLMLATLATVDLLDVESLVHTELLLMLDTVSDTAVLPVTESVDMVDTKVEYSSPQIDVKN
jgi:hypothetical protein